MAGVAKTVQKTSEELEGAQDTLSVDDELYTEVTPSRPRRSAAAAGEAQRRASAAACAKLDQQLHSGDHQLACERRPDDPRALQLWEFAESSAERP